MFFRLSASSIQRIQSCLAAQFPSYRFVNASSVCQEMSLHPANDTVPSLPASPSSSGIDWDDNFTLFPIPKHAAEQNGFLLRTPSPRELSISPGACEDLRASVPSTTRSTALKSEKSSPARTPMFLDLDAGDSNSPIDTDMGESSGGEDAGTSRKRRSSTPGMRSIESGQSEHVSSDAEAGRSTGANCYVPLLRHRSAQGPTAPYKLPSNKSDGSGYVAKGVRAKRHRVPVSASLPRCRAPSTKSNSLGLDGSGFASNDVVTKKDTSVDSRHSRVSTQLSTMVSKAEVSPVGHVTSSNKSTIKSSQRKLARPRPRKQQIKRAWIIWRADGAKFCAGGVRPEKGKALQIVHRFWVVKSTSSLAKFFGFDIRSLQRKVEAKNVVYPFMALSGISQDQWQNNRLIWLMKAYDPAKYFRPTTDLARITNGLQEKALDFTITVMARREGKPGTVDCMYVDERIIW
jgi:hypothetical protein